MAMTQNEQKLRHNKNLREERNERLKILLSFVVVAAYICAAVISIINDEPWLGGIILIGGVITALIKYYSRPK